MFQKIVIYKLEQLKSVQSLTELYIQCMYYDYQHIFTKKAMSEVQTLKTQ